MKIFLYLFFVPILSFSLSIGKVPTEVSLVEDQKNTFNSATFKGQTTLVFYLDPDVKDLNFDAREAIQEFSNEGYNFNVYGIMNMQATWIPNFAIEMELEKEHERYPKVVYIKDDSSVLLNKWELEDDNDNILLFNTKGELIFIEHGKLTKKRLNSLLGLIKKH